MKDEKVNSRRCNCFENNWCLPIVPTILWRQKSEKLERRQAFPQRRNGSVGVTAIAPSLSVSLSFASFNVL